MNILLDMFRVRKSGVCLLYPSDDCNCTYKMIMFSRYQIMSTRI